MTEYQLKKREAEFEKEHEAYFKEVSDADYLHEKIYFYAEGIPEETLEQAFLCTEQPVPSADLWACLGGGLAQGCGHSGATSGFD